MDDETNDESEPMVDEVAERAELIVTSFAYDNLGLVTCPKCQSPMVARMGRRGPFWQCRCKVK